MTGANGLGTSAEGNVSSSFGKLIYLFIAGESSIPITKAGTKGRSPASP